MFNADRLWNIRKVRSGRGRRAHSSDGQSIQDGQVVLTDRRKVPHGIDDLPHLFLKRFDLLYNRTNSAELVGKTGIYLGDDDAYTFASYLIRIRFLST